MLDYGRKSNKININSLLPKDFSLPEELFAVNLAKSSNPTINFCDAMIRKAGILQENYIISRSQTQPIIDISVTPVSKK